jgi:hypothetical protein
MGWPHVFLNAPPHFLSFHPPQATLYEPQGFFKFPKHHRRGLGEPRNEQIKSAILPVITSEKLKRLYRLEI